MLSFTQLAGRIEFSVLALSPQISHENSLIVLSISNTPRRTNSMVSYLGRSLQAHRKMVALNQN